MADWGYWLLVSIGIVVGALLLITVVGCFLPRTHHLERSLSLKQPPEAVWQTITDYPGTLQWHKAVTRVERLSDRDGHEVWKETYQNGYGLVLETTEQMPTTRLVRTMLDEGGPFTGRWEFALHATDTGCHLSITEWGEISNPFFRVMARLYMKQETYLELYLTQLAKKFDESPTIEKMFLD